MLSFNSCMVQLKFEQRRKRVEAGRSFNSCMVQLKYSATVLACDSATGFNSCMVQLKSLIGPYTEKPTYVLIPVWCN